MYHHATVTIVTEMNLRRDGVMIVMEMNLRHAAIMIVMEMSLRDAADKTVTEKMLHHQEKAVKIWEKCPGKFMSLRVIGGKLMSTEVVSPLIRMRSNHE